MAFSNQLIVFLAVFIVGCITVRGADVIPACTLPQFEACSKPAVDAINSTGSLCQGQADRVIGCFEELSCALTSNMETTKAHLLKSVNTSASGCAAEEAASGTTSCSAKLVDGCLGEETKTDDCQKVQMVELCLPSLLEKCLNETVKATLEAKKTEMEKKKTDLKCCNMQEMQTCSKQQMDLNNETATEENCMKLSKAKACVDDLLETCGEPKFVPTLNMKLNTTMIQIDICKDKGYKVVSDNNGGVSLQPAVALLLSLGFVVMKQLSGGVL